MWARYTTTTSFHPMRAHNPRCEVRIFSLTLIYMLAECMHSTHIVRFLGTFEFSNFRKCEPIFIWLTLGKPRNVLKRRCFMNKIKDMMQKMLCSIAYRVNIRKKFLRSTWSNMSWYSREDSKWSWQIYSIYLLIKHPKPNVIMKIIKWILSFPGRDFVKFWLCLTWTIFVGFPFPDFKTEQIHKHTIFFVKNCLVDSPVVVCKQSYSMCLDTIRRHQNNIQNFVA